MNEFENDVVISEFFLKDGTVIRSSFQGSRDEEIPGVVFNFKYNFYRLISNPISGFLLFDRKLLKEDKAASTLDIEESKVGFVANSAISFLNFIDKDKLSKEEKVLIEASSIDILEEKF